MWPQQLRLLGHRNRLVAPIVGKCCFLVVNNSLTERGEFKIVDTPVYKAVWQIGLGEGPFLPLSEISPIPPSPSYPPSLRIDR